MNPPSVLLEGRKRMIVCLMRGPRSLVHWSRVLVCSSRFWPSRLLRFRLQLSRAIRRASWFWGYRHTTLLEGVQLSSELKLPCLCARGEYFLKVPPCFFWGFRFSDVDEHVFLYTRCKAVHALLHFLLPCCVPFISYVRRVYFISFDVAPIVALGNIVACCIPMSSCLCRASWLGVCFTFDNGGEYKCDEFVICHVTLGGNLRSLTVKNKTLSWSEWIVQSKSELSLCWSILDLGMASGPRPCSRLCTS